MSIYTHAEGATQHPEEVLDFLLSRVIKASGVSELGNSNLLVEESDTPAMTVKVNAGKGYLLKSDNSKVYPVFSDAEVSVPIEDNASGQTRIDAIVLYYNLGASPNADSTGMITAVAIEGTPAGSPVAPTDNEIQTAVGASNPWMRLADVNVDTGETTILDADITDQRLRAYKMKGNEDYITITDQATLAIDFEEGSKQQVTLGGNRTVGAPTNMQAGDELWLKVIQDGTGSRTLTWFSGIEWAEASEVELSTDASFADIIGIIKTGDGAYEGFKVVGGFDLS